MDISNFTNRSSVNEGKKAPLHSRLRGIYMENFQSIKQPTYLELNGLTFLYGPNSAGKSSIIDALRLWKLSVGAEKSDLNNEALWRHFGSSDSKLGLSFISSLLDDTDGTDVARWMDDQSLYFSPHVEFMRKTYGKMVQVEYAGGSGTIKVAIDNRPTFEIHSDSIEFTEDFKLVTSDDESIDADIDSKYLYGRLVIYKSTFNDRALLGGAWDLIESIRDQEELRIILDGKKATARYEDLPETAIIMIEEADRYEIRGIDVDIFSGKHSRIGVGLGMGLDRLLRTRSKSKGGKDLHLDYITDDVLNDKIRSRLHNHLQELAVEIDLIVTGLFFQIRKLMSYSHVSGDRRTLSLKYPVYISPDLDFLNKEGGHLIHPSVGKYAKAMVDNANKRKSNQASTNIVEHSIRNHLISLKGYALKINALKVFDPSQTRFHRLNRQIPEGLIIRMKIQTPSGDVLGLEEVGSGISYILPILTSLWASDTSFIEQPELHLHPAAQCEVGDVIIAAASQGKNCIVESHSEHILLRILRRMRETSSGLEIDEDLKLTPDQVAVYYFHPEGKGSTKVIRIRIDRQGELLTEWPGGFFSERERELFS
jgi:predicted ATPase